MKSLAKLLIFTIPLVVLLSGCGGGGSSSSLTQITFSDWKSITKPSQVNLEGISADVSYKSSGTKITEITPNKVIGNAASASINYKANNTVNKISFTTQNGTVTFNDDGTDIIVVDINGGISDSNNLIPLNMFVGINPLHPTLNWNYQTFGVWKTGIINTGTGSGTAGGLSVGSATSGQNIPTSGTAIYNGRFIGNLSDFDGDPYFTGGKATLGANFANRTLTFNTTESNLISQFSAITSSMVSLNITNTLGTKLSWNSATNSFTGNVKDGAGLTGTV